MAWGPWSECQRETLGLPAWGAPNPGAELFRGSPVAPPTVPQGTSLLRRVILENLNIGSAGLDGNVNGESHLKTQSASRPSALPAPHLLSVSPGASEHVCYTTAPRGPIGGDGVLLLAGDVQGLSRTFLSSPLFFPPRPQHS